MPNKNKNKPHEQQIPVPVRLSSPENASGQVRPVSNHLDSIEGLPIRGVRDGPVSRRYNGGSFKKFTYHLHPFSNQKEKNLDRSPSHRRESRKVSKRKQCAEMKRILRERCGEASPEREGGRERKAHQLSR